ncbi:MAG TPA: ATP-binding cassette domain-containing protein [Thermoanaerobaculia bacterium]
MLAAHNIVKAFGATRAVDDASLLIGRGEIVAVVGENGAGKTTLMRIAAGELSADSGTVTREGRVELVHQHFMLVSELTISENLALARGTRAIRSLAVEEIAASGIALAGVDRRVADLSVGEKSKLELIKAIAKNPSTLILDEPTAVLTPLETEELFRVMRRLAAAGTAVVFISHKLPEVLAVADRIVAMRGGRVVAERLARETTAEELAEAMVGARVPRAAPRSVSGEIVAIVGVAGNGQRELAASYLQRDHEHTAHIPEDRTRDGIIAELSIAENLALTDRHWRPREARQRAQQAIERFRIKAENANQKLGSLSGGNQQKVILARELGRNPRLIVAAEPTRGLDIDATRFVHDELRQAAANGAEVLLITSDLDEAFTLATAVQVIYRGKLSPRMTPEEAREKVAKLMAGIE